MWYEKCFLVSRKKETKREMLPESAGLVVTDHTNSLGRWLFIAVAKETRKHISVISVGPKPLLEKSITCQVITSTVFFMYFLFFVYIFKKYNFLLKVSSCNSNVYWLREQLNVNDYYMIHDKKWVNKLKIRWSANKLDFCVNNYIFLNVIV